MAEPFTLAWKYHSVNRCVIPSGGGEKGKQALVKWEPYQTKRPSDDEVNDWNEQLQPKVWAMVTGPVSGIFVVDCDTAEACGMFDLAGMPPHVRTPRGGAHYYFRYPQFKIDTRAGVLPKIDIRGEGGYVNFAGGKYDVKIIPTDDAVYPMTRLPKPILTALQNVKAKGATRADKPIPSGERDQTLTSLAGTMRKKGMSISAMEAALLTVNQEQCDPPLAESDVVKIARSVGRYEPDAPKPKVELLKPELKCEQRGSGYEFKWDNLSLTLSRLKEHRDNRVNGELKIIVTNSPPTVILQSSINLLATRTRKDVAKSAAAKSPNYDWDAIIDDICTQSLDAMREGEPVVTLVAGMEVPPPSYLVFPLVAEKQANFLYGPGASGKSLLGLYLAACMMFPDWKNPLGLEVQNEPRKVLYLDWEAYEGEINWRVNMLAKGHSLDGFFVEYRRMHRALADDIEAVSSKLLQTGCDVVIVDSVAAAAGGNVNTTESSLPMFAAIRYLNVTPIFIAHTGKDKEKGIYGNIFFENYGRNNWELKTERGENMEVLAGLFHTKGNMSQKLDPFGMRLKFTKSNPNLRIGDVVTVESMSAADFRATDAMASEIPLHEKVIKILSAGPLPLVSIASELGITDPKKLDSLRTKLYRYDQIFERHGNEWQLKAHPGTW